MKDILLITPPFTQLNTPYPATSYLKGFLNTKNISNYQIDLGIEVILALFSKKGLENLFENANLSKKNTTFSENSQRILSLKEEYIKTIDLVIKFLQNKKPTLARQICSMNFLPEANRFNNLEDLDFAFGNMGLQDKAKHLATLYLEDLSDFIVENVDENFGFSRYAEKLGRSANTFDDLYHSLQGNLTYIDHITLKILHDKIQQINPKLICFSVPFPGNLYSAFRCAQYIKKHFKGIKTAFGGGFANTELRELKDQRVFYFFDYISLDNGERPLELIYQNCLTSAEELKRTFILENNQVAYKNNTNLPDYKQIEVGTPDYTDLLLDSYISVIEVTNPMHTLWSDGRWNKLTMAHGCYWGKCTFCDISLDYIKIYEPIAAKILVDRMEEIIEKTGENGFHFVDEAAPPSLMKALAIEILKRNLVVTWWTNIRFEKSFTRDLCWLLKQSGCIAVSGGLEVASDRLLQLINKGVTVSQVAKVCRNFTEVGIMVHSYLMYGYPTQTIQETIDSLEMVRQLFEMGVIQSGFWHQFAMTAHSPIGLQPEEFGIIPHHKKITFAHNDIEFTDKTGINHSIYSLGLKKALYNYMLGVGFDLHLQKWFDTPIPKTKIHSDYIHNILLEEDYFTTKPNSKIIWTGTKPLISYYTKNKKGNTWEMAQLTFHEKSNLFSIRLEKDIAIWLMEIREKTTLDKLLSYNDLKNNFELTFDNFELFWNSKSIQILRENGVILVL